MLSTFLPAALLLLLASSHRGTALSLKEDRQSNPQPKLPEASKHEPEGRKEPENTQSDEKSEEDDDCKHLAKPFSTFAASGRRLSTLPNCSCGADRSGISAVGMNGSGSETVLRFCKQCPGMEVKMEGGHKWCEDHKTPAKTELGFFCSLVHKDCRELLVYYGCQCPSNHSEDHGSSGTPRPLNNIQNNNTNNYSKPDNVAIEIQPIVTNSSSSPSESLSPGAPAGIRAPAPQPPYDPSGGNLYDVVAGNVPGYEPATDECDALDVQPVVDSNSGTVH